MIRATDFVNASAWARPASAESPADSADPSIWFDDDGASVDVCVSPGLSPASRGLSVEQHANRVLSFLCDASHDRK